MKKKICKDNFKGKKKENVYSKISSYSFTPEEYERKKDKLTSFFLDKNYAPMTAKQMKIVLDVDKSGQNLLDLILTELESEGIIYLDDSKRYVTLSKKDLLKCTYELKSKNFGFAICEAENEDDIYISSDLSLGAMDKDDILVKLTENGKAGDRRTGRVIKILKRNTTKVIGKYIKNTNFGFVEPIDSKIQDIFISKKNDLKAKDGSMVQIDITKYAEGKNKAEGKIIDIIGGANTPNIEVKALYKSYWLDEKEKFNELIMKEIENIPDIVSEQDKVGRIDKTNEKNIFTIDSQDAMDLDDAICVKKLSDNEYILSVFIADVSNYVKDGTNLDKEAIARATSVYIPGTVIPMLPKKLSNGICSLNAGVERLALSIDIKIDGKGKTVESHIYKAVIKVTKKMTYEKVYKVILGEDEEVLEEYKDYIQDIALMKELAAILNARRIEEGSINFDIPETKVVLDSDGNVINIKPYETNIANNIIEEFMLAANMTIAEKFYFLQAPFIYRIHEKPDEEKLRNLNELIGNYNKKIKGLKNIHPKTLSDILNGFEDEESKAVISKLMLRTLKLAKYSHECVGHFGLAAEYYCHFTSPIRRYPDLFIHRVISEYIANDYLLAENKANKYFKQAEKYSLISSDMEKEATKIERDFDDLYKAIYMKDEVGKKFEAVISSITSFGMFVKLENTVEGLISFDAMNDDYYTFDEKKYRLIGERTGKVYKIGDKLKVKLVRVDVRAKQIDFAIV